MENRVSRPSSSTTPVVVASRPIHHLLMLPRRCPRNLSIHRLPCPCHHFALPIAHYLLPTLHPPSSMPPHHPLPTLHPPSSMPPHHPPPTLPPPSDLPPTPSATYSAPAIVEFPAYSAPTIISSPAAHRLPCNHPMPSSSSPPPTRPRELFILPALPHRSPRPHYHLLPSAGGEGGGIGAL